MEPMNPSVRPPARRRIYLVSFGLALLLSIITMLLLFATNQARAQPVGNVADIEIRQELLNYTGWLTDTVNGAQSPPLILAGQRATIRTRIRNTGSTAVDITLGQIPLRVEDTEPTDPKPKDDEPTNPNTGCPPWCCLTCTLVLAGDNPALTLGNFEIQDFRTFPLGPGEERLFERPVLRMEQEMTDELKYVPPIVTISSDIDVCLADGSNSCPDPVQNPSLTKRSTLDIQVIRADLGDAPDSTNHASSPMPAYPNVQAEFPTVFDPATGAPSGPVHRNPRPFHLGAQVSLETEADVGPDQDPRNNIVPATNNPNNDRFDDGIRPAALNFEHCRASTFEVAVFIHPTMKAELIQRGVQRAYLNAWIDGNRDGDWADVVACSGGGPAIEHFMIDEPVNIAALAPGVNLLSVISGPVPWPEQFIEQPAWLRLTLSETPSTKTDNAGDIRYGDGRGAYAGTVPTIYRIGETEDYLINRRSAAGADVSVRMQARQIYDGEPRVAWAIEYRNLGDAGASDVILSTGDIPGDLLANRSVPPLPTSSSGNQLRFNIGALEPGAGGRILLQTDAPDLNTGAYTLTVSIAASNDTDTANNQAIAGVRPGLPAPLITSPGDGTTCSPDVTVSGRATPGATVRLRVNSEPVENSVIADNQGNWSINLQLSDGPHLIEAIAGLNSRLSPIARPLRVIVDSRLPYDPLSLRVTDSDGNRYRPLDANGRTDNGDWRLRFPGAGSYSISVRSCCESPGTEISIDFANPQLTDITLSDGDNDGVYSGEITVPTGSLSSNFILIVVCGEVSNEYPGSAESTVGGMISDATSGEVISGAEVLLLVQRDSSARSNDDAGDASLIIEPWPAAAFGQQNPQTTGNDGVYRFFPPPSVYQVLVRREGYYPYRSENIAIIAESIQRNITLIPRIDDPAIRQIGIGPDGFDETVLIIKPGEVIELVNLDDRERYFLSRQVDPSTAPAATGTLDSSRIGSDGGSNLSYAQTGTLDSGKISPGSSYKLSYTQAGTYYVSDGANGFDNLTIIVDPQAGGERVYLPLVVKR
jgi:hypothetical protein